jgi:hypothetical protein
VAWSICITWPAAAATVRRDLGHPGQSRPVGGPVGAPLRHPATIVVPEGNSREKNAAMRALGVDLIEHGANSRTAANTPSNWLRSSNCT